MVKRSFGGLLGRVRIQVEGDHLTLIGQRPQLSDAGRGVSKRLRVRRDDVRLVSVESKGLFYARRHYVQLGAADGGVLGRIVSTRRKVAEATADYLEELVREGREAA